MMADERRKEERKSYRFGLAAAAARGPATMTFRFT
jgi:hypothetical protein